MILPIDTDLIADLDRVGSLMDRDGFDAVPVHLLRAIAEEAKTIRPAAASVLLDPADPTVARERAFAVIACSLIGARSRRTLTSPTAAPATV